MNPFIVSLTGPSCAGKSTLEQALKTAGFENVISTTTRAPRAGEIDGQSYYFIDKSEFKRLRDTGAFIETVEFNGNYYGVLASEIERLSLMGKPIVVIVEPEGLRQIVAYCRTHDWPLMKVFVGNPGVVIAKRFFGFEMQVDLCAHVMTVQGFFDFLQQVIPAEQELNRFV